MRAMLPARRRYAPPAVLVAAYGLLGCSAGAGGATSPSIPASALLDAYDQAVLDATARDAPTFAEVAADVAAEGTPAGSASGETDRPVRFRAWLGWAWPACEPCPWDQAATCVPRCQPSEAFVCVRPSRSAACRPEETVSTRVDNGGQPLPAAGVYVFEGHWSGGSSPGASTAGPAAIIVERIAAVHPPEPPAP